MAFRDCPRLWSGQTYAAVNEVRTRWGAAPAKIDGMSVRPLPILTLAAALLCSAACTSSTNTPSEADMQRAVELSKSVTSLQIVDTTVGSAESWLQILDTLRAICFKSELIVATS